MQSMISRGRQAAAQDPNHILAAKLGPAFSAYRLAWARAEAGERPGAPLHLDIDVTTACNLKCPMCPAGAVGRHIFPGFKPGLFLDEALYAKALDEGASFGLPSLRLGVTGEPLLVKDIDRWVAEARGHGLIDVSLITNGQLLTPQMSRRLISAGLTRLMISIDAATQETYRLARPGGDWAKLMENINAFIRLRAEASSPLPLLRLSFIEMSLNEGEAGQFKNTFGPLADYLAFQRYQNILGQDSTNLSLPSTPAVQAGYCPEPYTRMALQVDGGLFPCCSDFGRVSPLGNLAADSILAVWNSRAALDLAGPSASGNEACRRCLAAGQE